MIISKKRIRILDSNLIGVKENQDIVLGVNINQVSTNLLKNIGFRENTVGETILPSSFFGCVSKFNAEGKYIPNRNLPKEKYYVERYWTWKQWVSGGGTEECSKIVYIERKRYQRDYIPPFGIELSILTLTNGEKIIVSPTITNSKENEKRIIHVINLFLEIFKECEVFSDDLESIVFSPNLRLNWIILRSGKRTWVELKEELHPIIEGSKIGKKPILEKRLDLINSFSPDFVATGNGGFRGYIIFGFSDKNTYILENAYWGNATYLFGNDWENLSRMTKTEILTNNLYVDRIIHDGNWENRINRKLSV